MQLFFSMHCEIFLYFFFFKNVMFYDFIYLAKGFRMRPKVRSTLKCLGKLARDENSFRSKYFDPDRRHLDFIRYFNTLRLDLHSA